MRNISMAAQNLDGEAARTWKDRGEGGKWWHGRRVKSPYNKARLGATCKHARGINCNIVNRVDGVYHLLWRLNDLERPDSMLSLFSVAMRP